MTFHVPHAQEVEEALARDDATRVRNADEAAVRLADAIAASDEASARAAGHAREAIGALIRDGTSHCCGAAEEFDSNASTEQTWRYRCSQCGLLQDRG
jgi:hypothetical protein